MFFNEVFNLPGPVDNTAAGYSTGSGRIASRAIVPDAMYRPYRRLFH